MEERGIPSENQKVWLPKADNCSSKDIIIDLGGENDLLEGTNPSKLYSGKSIFMYFKVTYAQRKNAVNYSKRITKYKDDWIGFVF